MGVGMDGKHLPILIYWIKDKLKDCKVIPRHIRLRVDKNF